MDTLPLCVGAGLIASAPLVVGHLVFIKNVRYILLSWFCSFVATISLILCSLTALITQKHALVLMMSVPIDNIGKIVVSKLAKKLEFLQTPTSRICCGLCCGIGYGLAHTLTMFLPTIMDQPYSLDFDSHHPYWFPNSLDFAFVYHALNIFQVAASMLYFRAWDKPFYLTYPIATVVHLVFAYITLIPYGWAKMLLMIPSSYALLIYFARSFRSLDYERVEDAPKEQPDSADVNLQDSSSDDQQ